MTAFGQHSMVPLFYIKQDSVALRTRIVRTTGEAPSNSVRNQSTATLQGLVVVLNAHTPGSTMHSIILATCDGHVSITDIVVEVAISPSSAFGQWSCQAQAQRSLVTLGD